MTLSDKPTVGVIVAVGEAVRGGTVGVKAPISGGTAIGTLPDLKVIVTCAEQPDMTYQTLVSHHDWTWLI